MKIFPGKQEKLITSVILAFVVGFGLGLSVGFSYLSIEILIPAFATLIAAFFWAWSAFFLEARKRIIEKREYDLGAANRLLYLLYERLNVLKLFQIDFVNPTRNLPGQMLSMAPVHEFRSPTSEFTAEEVSFLFQTKHKDLMLLLHVANEQFYEAVKAIRLRSDLHLNIIQPLIERAGHRQGEPLTNIDIKNAVGERNYELLRQATEAVVSNVDMFVERGDELRERLINTFSELFSQEEIFRYELLETTARSKS